MATITANTGSNNWNTNGCWVGGVQPSAADDVVIPSSAIVTIPATTTVAGRSVSLTGTGRIIGTATDSILNIGDATAGAGNVALSIAGTATVTNTVTRWVINFISTSATQQTINTGGKTMPDLVWNGAGSSYKLAAALTSSTTGVHTVLQGALDTGNFNMTGNGFIITGTLTRSVTLGSSTMTYSSSGAIWSAAVTTNLTFSAGTSNIALTNTSGTVTCGGLTYNNFSINSGSSSCNFTSGGATFATLTFTNGASPLAAVTVIDNIAVTGLFTVTGNSQINRHRIISSAIGTPRTITAGSVSLSNANFRDINNPGTTWTGTSLGDALGNTGITFTTPVTRYAVAAGNWSSTAVWSATTGGASGATVPLPQDTVFINGSSGVGTIVTNEPDMGADIDMTGYTGTINFNITSGCTAYGSPKLASGATYIGTSGLSLSGRSTHTITSATKTFPNPVTIAAPGGTYTLQDDFIEDVSANTAFTVNNGTFNANNKNLTMGRFSSGVANTRAITMGSGLWTLAGTGTIWNVVTGGLTFSSDTSSIKVTDTSATTKTFTFFNAPLYNFEISASTLGVSGSVAMNGQLVYNGLFKLGQGVAIIRNSVTTFSNIAPQLNGVAGNQVSIASSVGGTSRQWSATNLGSLSYDYLTLQDSTAAGAGTAWYAGANSTNVSGNSGWIFSVAPAAKQFTALGVG